MGDVGDQFASLAIGLLQSIDGGNDCGSRRLISRTEGVNGCGEVFQGTRSQEENDEAEDAGQWKCDRHSGQLRLKQIPVLKF